MTSDIQRWLDGLGLAKYAKVFAENEIDFGVLPHLGEDDLKDLGLPMGPRKKLLAAIAEIGTSAPAAADPEMVAREAERRQLTVMFVDLVGSTALSEDLDPEDYREVIRIYQDACVDVVARYEGHLAKFLGDGILIYFGYPRAHEDDAERAVRAGLGIVEGIAGLEPRDGISLQTRVGIATGLVVAGDLVGEGASEEGAVSGPTPNLAARLQALAEPNTVLISAATQRLVEGLFVSDDLGPQQIKGMAEPATAFRVREESGAASRFEATARRGLTPLVGRQEEIGLLLKRWDQTKEREGQVVLLSGEAGVGKSRIVRGLRDRLEGELRNRVLYFCSPYHRDSALHPAIDQLQRGLRFEKDDDSERKLSKLEAVLQDLELPVDDIAPVLASLLSLPTGERYQAPDLSPDQLRKKTLATTVTVIEAMASQSPVLMVVEDAHWIDPSTQELLGQLIEGLRSARILLLITCRPEFEPPWGGHTHLTALTLNRLSRRECAELVDNVTTGKALPDEVLDQIITRTDGVPLFVEELTKTILGSGLLAEQTNRYVLSGPLPVLAIPETLQDSLMARLDRLGRAKEVAQMAAMLGRTFAHELITAVWPREESELGDALSRLAEAELIYRRGLPPDATYEFKHALVQEVAYESLLRSKRQQLHQRIAAVLEERFPAAAESEPEVLAHHYTEADLPAKAAPYWLSAGRLASARSAIAEAIAHLRRGIDVLEDVESGRERSDLELDMQINLASAQISAHGYAAEQTEQAYLRARELLGDVSEDVRQFAVLYGLCVMRWNWAQFAGAAEVAQELFARATKVGEPAPICVGRRSLAMTYNAMGKFALAHEHAVRGAELYDREAHGRLALQYGHDIGVAVLNHQAIAEWYLGYADRASPSSEEATSIARESGHANTIAYDYSWQAFMRLTARDTVAAQDVAERLMGFADDRGMALWSAIGRCWLGAATAAGDQPETAIELLREGRAARERIRSNVFLPTVLYFEAEALTKLGRVDEALGLIGEALAVVETTEERWWEAELHRLEAEIERTRGAAPDVAEAGFRRAIEVARAQGAKPLELRATTSLARLWHDQCKTGEARGLLDPIYGWFTEGFDTPDLKEAKALLDELA